jgi:maltooligosyltrehalose trehalohydrolase
VPSDATTTESDIETTPPPGPAWRRLPVGAEPAPGGGVHFRVWAPRRARVELLLEEGGTHLLAPEDGGYHAALVAGARVGSRYRFLLDGTERCPDPASRFQPDGPHGPSEVVDPAGFPWTDDDWKGPPLDGQVLYEMHIGTFTPEGTWRAASRELAWLAELGITTLEVMPVATFPGRFGWGYDGVDLFAPTPLYGTPDDFRAFVNEAHRLGLAVILDVVYNHLGPDGNYLGHFAEEYFSREHETDWGLAPNFDGEARGPVREFFVANAVHWVSEYHLDGLRLDATQDVKDRSRPYILSAMRAAMHRAAQGRRTLVVGENEPQECWLLRATSGDIGGDAPVDMLWNDDWHHAAHVALTGQREAYYTDYLGSAQEFVSAARHGFLYQGQFYGWQQKRRGTSTAGIPARHFVHFLENHDQVANSARGLRMHQLSSPGRWRALTALLLLGPQTPMLFQGEEFASSAPFLYFADHEEPLAGQVRKGRAEFLAQFPSVSTPAVRDAIADPAAPDTFARCRLDHSERERHVDAVALHRDLLRLRRDDAVIARQGARAAGVDGAILRGDDAFVLRMHGDDGDDRLLLVNLGATLRLDAAPEPLLAPPAGMRWSLAWSSNDPRYGGPGAAHPEADRRMQGEDARTQGPLKAQPVWHLPGECALLLTPVPLERTA